MCDLKDKPVDLLCNFSPHRNIFLCDEFHTICISSYSHSSTFFYLLLSL